MLKRIALLAFIAAAFVHATVAGADAGNRTTSDQSVEVWHGQRRSTTTWKQSSGHGNVQVKTTWDPEPRRTAEAEEATEEVAAGAESDANEAGNSDGAAKQTTGKDAKSGAEKAAASH